MMRLRMTQLPAVTVKSYQTYNSLYTSVKHTLQFTKSVPFSSCSNFQKLYNKVKINASNIFATGLWNGNHHLCRFQTKTTVYAYRYLSTCSEIPFKVIKEKAHIDKTSEEFSKNINRFEKTVEIYQQAVSISLAGGGEKSIERHVKRHGKMVITDRLKSLFDDEYLELSLIGGIGMEYGHIPRANALTAIGKVMGRYCLVLANDGAFKGGSIYPVTLKKQLRAQEIAEQNRLPCIYLVDSAGAFLPLQSEIFNLGGRAFYNEAVMSAAKIPQIAIVCGSCTAGGAYIPTMADEAVIVHKTGTIFLGGPPLVQAALGEIVSAEDLGGATLHCGTSGCTDYFAENEADALRLGRDIVASLNVTCNDALDSHKYDEPLFDVEELPGIIPAPHNHHKIDMYKIIARIVDGSRFHEFKSMFGTSMLTGFAHIKGHLVGIIASQGEIMEREASKGAHFVQLCCQRDIPLVFLQNTSESSLSQSNTKETAIVNSVSLKSQARMLATVSCASVPKITVIVGNGFGHEHYIMGGRAVSPNFLFAWPNARVATMEPTKLARAVAEESDEFKQKEEFEKLVEKHHRESSAIFGATRILNDGIILPQETRKVLSECLSICKAYRQPVSQDYPVLRM
ncbi:methylcrotonoyl-CoA carboxylase beta chain, mitochondrial-like [Physella acuta]|uniref:methylcrotonoyl-CoA carboxylase beta chain, mitochondrial-like n=1 Tax=Physella acuta TaxID=109671 RepID=UPI0027DBD6FA|nr:methylcrotonoyl-CoA carboxylase beta chain, mitochondrial-like [Physella acuta]